MPISEFTVEKVAGPRAVLIQAGVIVLILWFVSNFNYLLFHSLVEILGVAIMVGIFMVAWNSRKFISNNFYLIIGIASLIIAGLDLLHAIVYKGVMVTDFGQDANFATQLWIAARAMMAISFFIGVHYTNRKMDRRLFLQAYFFVFLLIILSIFYWKIFPESYQDGQLTIFKIISEYIIILILFVSLYLLAKKRHHFERRVFMLLTFSIVALVISEIFFTLYGSTTDMFNRIGHLFKIAGIYFEYVGIVECGLMKPYRVLFRELKDNEVKFRNLAESIKDSFFALDNQMRIIYWNKAMEDLTGIKSADCVGDKITSVKFAFRSIELLNYYSSAFLTQQPFTIVQEVAGEMESDFFEVSIYPSAYEISIFIRKITDRIRTEQVKDEFLSLASHQLKTPLASISLSSELMLRGIGADSIDEQKEYLQEINNSSKQMDRLIVRLLEISKIEMGAVRVNYRPVNAYLLVKSIITKHADRIEKKQLALNSRIRKNFRIKNTDSKILDIILDNLISNAIKYSRDGGEINVRAKKVGVKSMIIVADNGIGIPIDQQKKIFEKNFRGANASMANSDGLGLGLYMVKLLVKKINAEIRFESIEGKGTTFYVVVPS